MILKSDKDWAASLNSELCTIPSHRTRSDPEAIQATIRAAQADALRYAADIVSGYRFGSPTDLRSIVAALEFQADALCSS